MNETALYIFLAVLFILFLILLLVIGSLRGLLAQLMETMKEVSQSHKESSANIASLIMTFSKEMQHQFALLKASGGIFPPNE